MKRLVLCAGIFIGMISMAEAQAIKATPAKPKAVTQKATPKNKTIKLESTSTNEAKATVLPKSSLGWNNIPLQGSRLQIADPIVNTLNARANGAPAAPDFREFMGIGRGAYGIANGHIMLRPTGSTTSGGITGTGAVGTGSTPGGPGMHAVVPTVNGKNPYAGPGMWGTTGVGIGTDFRRNELSIRTLPLRDPNY